MELEGSAIHRAVRGDSQALGGMLPAQALSGLWLFLKKDFSFMSGFLNDCTQHPFPEDCHWARGRAASLTCPSSRAGRPPPCPSSARRPGTPRGGCWCGSASLPGLPGRPGTGRQGGGSGAEARVRRHVATAVLSPPGWSLPTRGTFVCLF